MAGNPDFVETDKNKMQFLFINDCQEDVGVLDWFYDKLASYMQEFLINVYSYLYWLKSRPDLHHYIYYGDTKLCECFDLEGCTELFKGYNLIISDDGKENYQTAGEYEEEEKLRCAFCHNLMESGRYSFFDDTKTMFICADCMDIIGDEDQLKEAHARIKKYLAINYPDVNFGYSDVVFAGEQEKLSALNEWYFRYDPDKRKITVGYELPSKNLHVAILLGMITMWQYDNDLMTEYAYAQLTYEQLKYLKQNNAENTADWVYNDVDQSRRNNVDEITERIGQNTKDTDDENSYTSFSFMRETGEEIRNLEDDVDFEDIEGEEYSDLLYDPNRTPRFWKRYFRLNEEDEDDVDLVAVTEDEDDVDDTQDIDETEDDLTPNACYEYVDKFKPNAPPTDDIDDEDDLDFMDMEEDLEEDLVDEEDDLDEIEDIEDIEDVEEVTDEVVDDDTQKIQDDVTEDDEDLSVVFDDEDEIEEIDDDETEDDEDLEDVFDYEDEGKDKKKKAVDDKKKAEKERKKKEKQLLKGQKKSEGLRKVPYEIEEENNPKVRVYNEIVRHAYNYDEGGFSRKGLSDKELTDIFYCAKHDYPELFWLNSYRWTSEQIFLVFRCKTASGVLDVKQINKKLKELRTGAKYFTKGITKKTDPYKALMTIYKRLILTLDYDSKGLDARIDEDMTKDDRLRSLHSAIVRHKTVCAGYAVAMQYLLQSVGIPCGYVVSEVYAKGCHAFNIVKIGKYCYYLDATWGDMSNTKNGDADNDIINYSYCCVPYSDFILTKDKSRHNHIPNHEMYPWFTKELKANRHEYYRYNKAYISRYNEDDLVRVFAGCATRYDDREDGRFTVSFRCTGAELANQLYSMVRTSTNYTRIVNKAKKAIAKNRYACKLLDTPVDYYMKDDANVITVVYKKLK